MKAVVRRADLSEAALIHDLTRASFATLRGRLDPPSGADAETVADVEAAMRRGGAVIAWDGATPVGAARWLVAEEALYVGRVAVLPDHRRQRVASALMRFLEDLAPTLGCDAVRVGVRASLPENVALYRSLGYEVVSIEPHEPGPDRVVTMRKRVRFR